MVGHPDRARRRPGRSGWRRRAGARPWRRPAGRSARPATEIVRAEVERLLGALRVLVARLEVDPEQVGVDDVPDDLVAGGVLRPDHRRVDREHDGLGAGVDRAREQRLGEGPVGREVGLQPPAHAGRGDVGERRAGVAGDDHDRPGGRRRLGHRQLTVGVDRPLLRGGRDPPRHPGRRPEQRHRQVDLRHVPQDVRQEPALRPARAAPRGCSPSRAHLGRGTRRPVRAGPPGLPPRGPTASVTGRHSWALATPAKFFLPRRRTSTLPPRKSDAVGT